MVPASDAAVVAGSAAIVSTTARTWLSFLVVNRFIILFIVIIRSLELTYPQAHHGEVVVGFGTIAVLLDFGLQGLNDLLGGVEVSVS